MDLRLLVELGSLVKDDNEVLIEQLMVLHGTELTNLAYAYIRDWPLAQDIVQDVFVKCYLKLDDFH